MDEDRDITPPSSPCSHLELSPKSFFKKKQPRGPWTLQTKWLPHSFGEHSLQKLRDELSAKNNYSRGYKFFKSEKVKLLVFSNTSSVVFVKSKVQSSFKLSQLHKCFIAIDKLSGKLRRSYCNCKGGVAGRCSHVFATLWCILDAVYSGDKYIKLKNTACTEQPRAWKTGSKSSEVHCSKFNDLLFVKNKPHKKSRNIDIVKNRLAKKSKIKASLTSEMIKNYVNNLRSLKRNESFCKALEENDFKVIENVSCDVQEVRTTQSIRTISKCILLPAKSLWENECRNILGNDYNSFTTNIINLSLKRCRLIEKSTKMQFKSEYYKQKKKTVLSSTKFHAVVKRRKTINSAFLSHVFSAGKELNDTLGYMKDGLDNEKNASKKYLKVKKGYKVYSCGLVINPGVPCLGASPDRIVCSDTKEYGLLEIKTLSKAISQNIDFESAIKQKIGANASYLSYESGIIKLKQNSSHYYQIQGQLALTGLSWCDYLVDGGNEFNIERIHFNPQFWVNNMLPKLVKFCHEHLPPTK